MSLPIVNPTISPSASRTSASSGSGTFHAQSRADADRLARARDAMRRSP